jgi:uncharacterized cupredoxin-like copper-binding protein
MRVRLVIFTAALVALAATTAAWAARPATKPQKSTVVVSMYEMGLKLSKTVVHRGTVTFQITNVGKVEHDFALPTARSATINGGEKTTLVAKFSKPGKYTFICTVEGHASLGMMGRLTVK